MADQDRQFQVGLTSDGILLIDVEGVTGNIVSVPPQEMAQLRVYVDASPGQAAATAGRTDVRIWVEDPTTGDRAYVDTHFNGRGE
jgi:hypothetical protein